MNIFLSILICTVPSRAKKFLPAILSQLEPQLQGLTIVELLYIGDNKLMTVGEKRNALVNMARGKYVVFVDDDDRIAPNYVQRLIDGIVYRDEANIEPDCVCFNAQIAINGGKPVDVYYSKNNKRDIDTKTAYLRIPNHLMCVKRSIAIETPYMAVSRGEDSQYAKRLLPKLKVEHLLGDTLYFYDFNSQTTETQK
jgi:glycosyltransferase involved in cell wall biosynthesis